MGVFEKTQELLFNYKMALKTAEIYRLKWELAKREIKHLKEEK